MDHLQGEICNFRDLRKELEVRGHSFRSDSDTEVILEAYRAWGTECLARLNGMFAFALYDGGTRRLFLARDRAGEKPLFYRLDPGRFVIPNALPLQEIERVPPVPNAVIGGHPGQKIVLYVGRFDHQKNLKNLVCALGRVAVNETVAAFLCGDGPMRPAVERMIHEAGLSGRIFLPGYVMNIWSWMKRADVFVSVSLFEGMPNTVMEAMACGCPAVVSDIPQHREILDDDSAVFVSPSDPMSIAAGIDRLLGDTEEAGRKALCAKERTLQWSIPAMAERYERAYLEILGAVK